MSRKLIVELTIRATVEIGDTTSFTDVVAPNIACSLADPHETARFSDVQVTRSSVLKEKEDLPFLERGCVRVRWINLNEGASGEFDPKNPDDVNYLRVDVSKWDDSGLGWEEIRSSRTRTPATTSSIVLDDMLEALMTSIYALVIEGKPIGNILDDFSNATP